MSDQNQLTLLIQGLTPVRLDPLVWCWREFSGGQELTHYETGTVAASINKRGSLWESAQVGPIVGGLSIINVHENKDINKLKHTVEQDTRWRINKSTLKWFQDNMAQYRLLSHLKERRRT